MDETKIMAKLNLPELTAVICKHLRKNVPVSYSAEEYKGNFILRVSADIDTADCGVFANTLTSCKLEDGTSCVTCTGDSVNAYLALYLTYEHFDGGSNGQLLVSLTFENGKWTANKYKGKK